MAIDIGDKWLGIAVSDPLRLIASPLATVRCESEEAVLDTVDAYVKEHGITMVVAGLPRSLDGSTGQQAVKVQKIIDHLSSKLGISIACQDERYSTNRAREILAKNKGHAKSTRTRDDAVAAALILEDYLKAHNPPGPDGNEFAPND